MYGTVRMVVWELGAGNRPQLPDPAVLCCKWPKTILVNPLHKSLLQLQEKLTAPDIASVVIGGVALSVWSRPRATYDVVFKVLPPTRRGIAIHGCLGQE